MNRTILVIDDDKLQAEQLAKALEREIPSSKIVPSFEEDDIFEPSNFEL